ncbi:hypothetical protein [Litchfieldia salsa]|uniref:Uncharacterized protein n=1 Tax=Litchfieldia salsa TaxID=930152 RepID=A0A1H0TKK3_9BACI|nr:hypothetical protein [Litchfieldia salsa]SDP54200.1 hypothetical protein SAMN05216565_103570 [Litchfieldia salsa]
MNSLVSKYNVINEIDSILSLTSQIDENLRFKTDEQINKGFDSQYEEIASIAAELRNLDLALNEQFEEFTIEEKKRSHSLIYKLSF